MGHVDSGKTNLAKFLSQVASTASFDHSPQSQDRGITIDLGFSSLSLPALPHSQFTLVDCPGHASLLRTVIGGAQIIDAVLLVIDSTVGMQVQSAECLILTEIVTHRLIVILSKIDLIPEGERLDRISLLTRKFVALLGRTRLCDAPIVAMSTRIPETKGALFNALERLFRQPPQRDPSGPFIMAVDHAFAIKGQGGVLTGTVLSGIVRTGDSIRVGEDSIASYKVKSLQVFRRRVQNARKGDRIGICLGQLDTGRLERLLVSTPGSLCAVSRVIVEGTKLRYYKLPIKTKSLIAISVVHEVVQARIHLIESVQDPLRVEVIDSDGAATFTALLEFTRPVLLCKDFLLIGWCPSLQMGVTAGGSTSLPNQKGASKRGQECRIIFSAKISILEGEEVERIKGKQYRIKTKIAQVERIVNEHLLIGRNLVSKGGVLTKFLGMSCSILHSLTAAGSSLHSLDSDIAGEGYVVAEGRIDSPFGTSGKFNVFVTNKISKVISLAEMRPSTVYIRINYRK